jgi:DNA-binding NarL/FixJ family response regulator
MADPSAILIAHKDILARSYLRGLIGRMRGAGDCREATSFNDVVDALAEHPAPRLALIDLDLPGMASDLGLRFFVTHYRDTRFVALFSALAIERIDRLEEAGVAACVPKDLSEPALVHAFTHILDGHPYRPPGCTAPAARSEPPHGGLPGFVDHELTERQGEVLRLLAMGRSNREIAQLLNIAEGTVKVHVNAAFRVLGVHNRVSAAAAIRRRIDELQVDHRTHVEG